MLETCVILPGYFLFCWLVLGYLLVVMEKDPDESPQLGANLV